MFIDYVRITVHADLIALPYGISAFYRKVYIRNLPYFITDVKDDIFGNDIDISCLMYRIIINYKTQAPATGLQTAF